MERRRSLLRQRNDLNFSSLIMLEVAPIPLRRSANCFSTALRFSPPRPCSRFEITALDDIRLDLDLLGISVGNVLARLLQCGLFLGVEVFECESLLRFELRDRFARIDGSRGRHRDAFLHRPMGLARLLEGRPSSW
jgi:hypothetical protein